MLVTLSIATPVVATGEAAEESSEAVESAEPSDASADAEAGTRDDPRRQEEYVEVDASDLPSSNTIGTKLPTELQKTPFHVGVVGRELMNEQSSTTISDALRNVSGLNPTGGTGVFDFYTLRGFNTQEAATFLIDGVIEPESSYYNLYNAAGVEVLKGPAGFLYGNSSFHGAIGGAVNLIRKQPIPGDFGTVRASGGSFDTYEGAVDWNYFTNENVGFRLNAVYNESSRFRDNQDTESYAVNPAVAFRLGENTRINVNAEFASSEVVPDTGIPLFLNQLPDVSRGTSYQSGEDFSDQEITRVQIDVEHRLNDRLSIRNKTYYRELDWDTTGTLFGAVFPTDPQGFPLGACQPGDVCVNRLLNRLDDQQELIGNQFDFIAELETGGIQHRLVAGFEIFQFEDEFAIDLSFDPTFNDILFDFVPLNNPVASTGATPTFIPFQGGNNETTVVAPYVIDQITFSPVFSVLVGARYDDIDFEDPDAFILGPFGVETRDVNRNDADISPMGAVTITPDDDVTLYVNFGQTFSPAGPRVIDDLAPQRSTQGEVGVKVKLADGRVRLSTAVYANEVDNVPTPGPDAITQLTADVYSEGIELEVAADLTNGWRLFGSYAYNDTELQSFQEFVQTDSFGAPVGQTIDRSGNTAAFAPENLFNAWVSKRINTRWSVGGGVRYVDEQFIDEDNVFTIDDYTRVDATVVYNRQPWRFRLNVDNLTDEDYEIRGFQTAVGSVIPAPGIAARGQVEFQF